MRTKKECMDYTVETNYLVHDGGTKFYETVLITSHTSDKAVLIKRYGPINKSRGGGTIIFKQGGIKNCRELCEKIVAEKRTLRSGKGKYVGTKGNHGLQRSPKEVFAAQDLQAAISAHYNDQDIARQVAAYFPAVLDMAPTPACPPEPEPVRDASWGTW